MNESEYNELVAKRFKVGNKRSEVFQLAYKHGFRFFLGKFNHLPEVTLLKCPYHEGSLEFDAWFAGWDNGRDDAQFQKLNTGKTRYG